MKITLQFFNFTTFIFKSISLIFLLLVVLSCQKKTKTYNEPNISLDSYKIEKGFSLQVAASEPFIEAPVAMDFDDEGRMWVVEMKGYMQNLEGLGDKMPNGTITILEDLDKDGVVDHAKRFLDSLVMPRAIAHVYGGLLYAEPPNLWFVEIENDIPKNKVLVDSLYSDGGNVEHQPNGLLMHLDNWIYSAKSNFKYQRKNGKWHKSPTTYRGQWGITKDEFGRLYYNNNSTLLLGDYVLPNVLIKNKYYRSNAALNKKITPTQRVFPLHATSVNRGYVDGVLDRDSLLINATSACGPLIYNGEQFPKVYNQNAFICLPEANLVKRTILNISPDSISAKQAIAKQEFLASTDEGFRPVNLNNGPDGAIYVVDMHRGIIQDKAFMTPYLKEHYAQKKLDTIIGMGRILKIHNKNNSIEPTAINLKDMESAKLVGLLNHQNGWMRNRAQQILVFRSDKKIVPQVKKIAQNSAVPLAQIHALYTLEGMGVLDFDTLYQLMTGKNNPEVKSHAIVLAEQFAVSNHANTMFNVINQLISQEQPLIDFYVSASLGQWISFAPKKGFNILQRLLKTYKNNKMYLEGILNSLRGNEAEFLKIIQKHENTQAETYLEQILKKTISNKKNNKQNPIYTTKTVNTDSRTAGYKIFRSLCATCHGIDGEGIESIAPPLKDSEYVTGSSKRLALILLHGLKGPIHINGKLYEFNAIMPGLANNPDFTDKDILDVISYLKNAFPGSKDNISIKSIKSLREQKPANGVFTEKELLNL